jgi:hypothetical protein
MFKNLFNAAIRSILRQKVYSLINILGLALGLASSILIAASFQAVSAAFKNPADSLRYE